jgi:DNA topoisomerase IB
VYEYQPNLASLRNTWKIAQKTTYQLKMYALRVHGTKAKSMTNLPLQQILSKLLSEVVVDLPLAQNELLRRLETQHHPKHPDE